MIDRVDPYLSCAVTSGFTDDLVPAYIRSFDDELDDDGHLRRVLAPA